MSGELNHNLILDFIVLNIFTSVFLNHKSIIENIGINIRKMDHID